MRPITVLLIELVDDKPTFLNIADSFQKKHDDMNTTGDGMEGLGHGHDPCPGDVFFDPVMSDLNGPEVVRRLRFEMPEVNITTMAVLDTSNYWWAAIRTGAGSTPKATSSTDWSVDS